MAIAILRTHTSETFYFDLREKRRLSIKSCLVVVLIKPYIVRPLKFVCCAFNKGQSHLWSFGPGAVLCTFSTSDVHIGLRSVVRIHHPLYLNHATHSHTFWYPLNPPAAGPPYFFFVIYSGTVQEMIVEEPSPSPSPAIFCSFIPCEKNIDLFSYCGLKPICTEFIPIVGCLLSWWPEMYSSKRISAVKPLTSLCTVGCTFVPAVI
jgi:hypothetical protein